MQAPVVLFTYKRPALTLKTLEHLRNNVGASSSTLIVFSDGPKDNSSPQEKKEVNEVRQIIRREKWCGEVRIIESDRNKGLADSIIDGVTEVVEKFGTAIVLEDDLISSKYFLEYMNEALQRYANDEKVMQISGHNFPVGNVPAHSSFFLRHATTLGWGVWARSWKYFDRAAAGYHELKTNPDLALRFNLNGAYSFTKLMLLQMEEKSVDSWGIRWLWSVFRNNGLTLFPDKTLIKHLESNAGATHVSGSYAFAEPDFDVNYRVENFPSGVAPDDEQFSKFKTYLKEAVAGKRSDNAPLPSNGIVDKVLNKIFKNKR